MTIPDLYHGARFIGFFAEVFRNLEESGSRTGARGTDEFMVRLPSPTSTISTTVLDFLTFLAVYRFSIWPVFQYQLPKIILHGREGFHEIFLR